MLDFGFMRRLHRRMFGEVWTWAGVQRRRVTNIGVEPDHSAVPDAVRRRQALAHPGGVRFTWGGSDLDVDGSGRAAYLAALIKAVDTDEHDDLIRFARGRVS
jgi:hypothetical protein